MSYTLFLVPPTANPVVDEVLAKAGRGVLVLDAPALVAMHGEDQDGEELYRRIVAALASTLPEAAERSRFESRATPGKVRGRRPDPRLLVVERALRYDKLVTAQMIRNETQNCDSHY
ncbi:MAG: hypothetical protein ACLQMF_10185 [Rectinemataceae bacterium]